MTLRQWYAGKALPAIIEMISSGKHSINDDGDPVEEATSQAFRVADAMIAFEAQEGGEK